MLETDCTFFNDCILAKDRKRFFLRTSASSYFCKSFCYELRSTDGGPTLQIAASRSFKVDPCQNGPTLSAMSGVWTPGSRTRTLVTGVVQPKDSSQIASSSAFLVLISARQMNQTNFLRRVHEKAEHECMTRHRSRAKLRYE